MSNGTASVSVWVGDQFVCIKLAGRVNFQHSIDFRTLINHLHSKGHKRFVIDLSTCQLMDSTFLGVLASLAVRFSHQQNGNAPTPLELLNPSERLYDTVDNLGITEHLKIIHGTPPAEGEFSPVEKSAASTDRAETTKTCLEAHRVLMELNPANVAKFKDVTRFLEEDLKRFEK